MTIRIGANPIGWSNDDMLELGGETPLEVCLAEAKEAGFEGMELGNKFPREPEALKKALAPFGMACVSGWYSAELLKRDADAEMKALRPHLDLLKAMGSNVLVFAETSNAIHGDRSKPLSQRPVMKDGDWAEFGRRITEGGRADPAGRRARGLSPPHGHHRANRRPISTPSCAPRARPCIFCSTPAMRPGAAPIPQRSPAATAAASAMCTPRTCARA